MWAKNMSSNQTISYGTLESYERMTDSIPSSYREAFFRDRNHDSDKWDHYFDIYDHLFKPLYKTDINYLEIGVQIRVSVVRFRPWPPFLLVLNASPSRRLTLARSFVFSLS